MKRGVLAWINLPRLLLACSEVLVKVMVMVDVVLLGHASDVIRSLTDKGIIFNGNLWHFLIFIFLLHQKVLLVWACKRHGERVLPTRTLVIKILDLHWLLFARYPWKLPHWWVSFVLILLAGIFYIKHEIFQALADKRFPSNIPLQSLGQGYKLICIKVLRFWGLWL